jgi:branched-chain amino acid transport system substrate-binding protein
VLPDIYAAQGYDAAYLLAEAIRRADDVTSSRLVRDKLASIANFEGVLGNFGWSAEREATVRPKVLIGDGAKKVFVAAPNA